MKKKIFIGNNGTETLRELEEVRPLNDPKVQPISIIQLIVQFILFPLTQLLYIFQKSSLASFQTSEPYNVERT